MEGGFFVIQDSPAVSGRRRARGSHPAYRASLIRVHARKHLDQRIHWQASRKVRGGFSTSSRLISAISSRFLRSCGLVSLIAISRAAAACREIQSCVPET